MDGFFPISQQQTADLINRLHKSRGILQILPDKPSILGFSYGFPMVFLWFGVPLLKIFGARKIDSLLMALGAPASTSEVPQVPAAPASIDQRIGVLQNKSLRRMGEL